MSELTKEEIAKLEAEGYTKETAWTLDKLCGWTEKGRKAGIEERAEDRRTRSRKIKEASEDSAIIRRIKKDADIELRQKAHETTWKLIRFLAKKGRSQQNDSQAK